jgi:predicted hotdog family 3-hydroxylacyl-ACP dehydratase
MAVHGALAGGALADGALADGASRGGVPAGKGRSEVGFLAGLRDVRLHVLRLDDIESDLICDALLVAGDHGSALYEFALTSEAQAQRLLSGRATVVFDANERFGAGERFKV